MDSPLGYKGNLGYCRFMARRALTIKLMREQSRIGNDISLQEIYITHFLESGKRFRAEEMENLFLTLFPGFTLDKIVKEFSSPLITDWSKDALKLFFEIPAPIFSYVLEDLWGDAVYLKLVLIRSEIYGGTS